jgi:hypothetical protein
MAQRRHEIYERVAEGAESAPATTWLEAATAILDQQAAPHRDALNGGSIDRSEARKHLKAIAKIKRVLESEGGLPKRKVQYEHSDDPLVRRMRRADLLCPKGWANGIGKKLAEIADASEQKYIDDEGIASTLNDQDMVDAQEIRAFLGEVNFVASRGEAARQIYARKQVSNG